MKNPIQARRRPSAAGDYQIWIVDAKGRPISYVEGAILTKWTKKVAMREYRAKYKGAEATSPIFDTRLKQLSPGERYAVVKVTTEVIT